MIVRYIPERPSVHMVDYEVGCSNLRSRCRHTLQRIGVAMLSRSWLWPHKMPHYSQASRSIFPLRESMYDHLQHKHSSLAINYEMSEPQYVRLSGDYSKPRMFRSSRLRQK
jgi:hypothetical protein